MHPIVKRICSCILRKEKETIMIMNRKRKYIVLVKRLCIIIDNKFTTIANPEKNSEGHMNVRTNGLESGQKKNKDLSCTKTIKANWTKRFRLGVALLTTGAWKCNFLPF